MSDSALLAQTKATETYRKRAEQAEAEAAKWREQFRQAHDIITKKISEIKSDERYTYPAANVFINAPLALIQVELEARVSALEFALKSIEALK